MIFQVTRFFGALNGARLVDPSGQWVVPCDTMVPISFTFGFVQLHTELRLYLTKLQEHRYFTCFQLITWEVPLLAIQTFAFLGLCPFLRILTGLIGNLVPLFCAQSIQFSGILLSRVLFFLCLMNWAVSVSMRRNLPWLVYTPFGTTRTLPLKYSRLLK